MSELNQIAEMLLGAKQVAIFTHINPDGDALGSAFASKSLLEEKGIPAEIWLCEEIPERYAYLGTDYRVWEDGCKTDADTALAVDCGSGNRLGVLDKLFLSVPTKLCIDHHLSSDPFGDVYYCVPQAAATAELIYDLALLFDSAFPKETKIGIYTGISTDTGHFKYSNASEKTFLVAADLLRRGINARAITQHLYDTVKLEKYQFMGECARRVQRYANGKIAALRCPDSLLAEYGMKHEDVEELPNMPVGIDGVILGVLAKDHAGAGLKYSLRGREVLDLSKIANAFGGGGHKNAAAFVSELPYEEVIRRLAEMAEGECGDV